MAIRIQPNAFICFISSFCLACLMISSCAKKKPLLTITADSIKGDPYSAAGAKIYGLSHFSFSNLDIKTATDSLQGDSTKVFVMRMNNGTGIKVNCSCESGGGTNLNCSESCEIDIRTGKMDCHCDHFGCQDCGLIITMDPKINFAFLKKSAQ